MQLLSNELTTCIEFGLNYFGVEDPWWISQDGWLSKWLWCVGKKKTIWWWRWFVGGRKVGTKDFGDMSMKFVKFW